MGGGGGGKEEEKNKNGDGRREAKVFFSPLSSPDCGRKGSIVGCWRFRDLFLPHKKSLKSIMISFNIFFRTYVISLSV